MSVFRNAALLFALLGVFAFFAFMSPAFLGPRNLSNLAVEMSITAVLALGMLLVLVTSHVDLSVGSGVGLLGGVAAVLVFHHDVAAPVAMGVSVVAAIVIWTLMGVLVVKQKIPAFIITLAGLLILKGAHWLVIKNATVPIVAAGSENAYSLLTTYCLPREPSFAVALFAGCAIAAVTARARRLRASLGMAVEEREVTFGKIFVGVQAVLLFVLVVNQYRGIPLSALVLAVTGLFVWTVTQHTRFGRHLYAVGGNVDAARISGVNVDAVVIGAFAIMGVIVAITGFMQTAYSGTSTTTIGGLMELDAIAACVIGGTSLRGGRGTVTGVLLGSLVMVTLLNGMTLLAVSPEIKFIARGAVLSIAVWLDVRLSQKQG